LGDPPDGKEIYLFTGEESVPVLREIARFRKITFRAIDEGSGKRRDLGGSPWLPELTTLEEGEGLSHGGCPL